MTDPTQVPPFFGTCTVTDGVVTELTGVANQHWLDTHPGHTPIPDGVGVGIGWLYDGATFTDPNPKPRPLPVEDTDV